MNCDPGPLLDAAMRRAMRNGERMTAVGRVPARRGDRRPSFVRPSEIRALREAVELTRERDGRGTRAVRGGSRRADRCGQWNPIRHVGAERACDAALAALRDRRRGGDECAIRRRAHKLAALVSQPRGRAYVAQGGLRAARARGAGRTSANAAIRRAEAAQRAMLDAIEAIGGPPDVSESSAQCVEIRAKGVRRG
jgi:hypothetical protein